MKRAARSALAVALLLALLAAPASAATTLSTNLPASSTVVVVLAPYLSWEDIESGAAPTIASLAEDGAIASVSIQTGSLDVSPPSARGAAIISAGEPVDVPGAGSTIPADPVGGLGESVLASGGFTAAIGTSATAVGTAPTLVDVPALLLAGDSSGTVSLLADSAGLIRQDVGVPYGVTADIDGLEAAYIEALASRAGKRLVVIDPGDLDRARAVATTPAEWEVMRTAAVHATDEAVAVVLASLPSDATLLVVSTAQYGAGATPGFGPIVLYGANAGVLASAGTRTEGLVTLPDVTATIAALLRVDAPEGTTGSALSIVADGRSSADRVAALASANDTARSLEGLRLLAWIIQGGSALVMMCVGILAVLLVARRKAPRPHARSVRVTARAAMYGLVATLALPIGMLLVRAVSSPVTAPAAWWRLTAWCVLAAGAALLLARWRGVAVAIGVVGCANALLIVIDQLLGAPLAAGSPLSYSLIFGTRFYGLGNEGAGIALSAVLIAVAWLFDRGVCPPSTFLLAGVPVVLVAVLPSLGANVGVAAWGMAGIVGAYLYAARRRVTWRVIAVALLGVLAVLGVAVVLDLSSSNASHLGQLLQSVRDGEDLAGIVARKMALSVETLFATPAMIALPVGIVLALRLLVHPSGPFGELVKANRGASAALCGAVAAAFVGLVTEDSGAIVAALVMFMPTAAVIALTLDRETTADEMGQHLPDGRTEES